MSKQSIPAIADDFSKVTSFLKGRGVLPQDASIEMLGNAKRLHRATYSLILWKFRLKKIPIHGQVFIEEIASDALQILPQALMGCGKTTKLLTRGIIENAMRHIYFLDHPVEFERMNREHKWYPGTDDLFAYPRIHPAFLDMLDEFDALSRLKSLYDELSAGVHGRRVKDLEMRAALADIAFEAHVFQEQVVMTERCAESVNFLLATFHREQISAFHSEDQRVILRAMPARARQIWRGLL